MNRIGIIDIGPNSIRLLLTEIEPGGYFRIIDDLHSPLRVCQDLVSDCNICEKNLQFITSTIKSYKALCSASGVTEIFTIATDAMRVAHNKDNLITSIKKQLDLDVKVLSIEEELRLIALGVTRSMYVKNSLLVQVSGNKTYLTWVQNNEIINTSILPFGSVNTSYNFNLTDRILKDDLENCSHYIKSNIQDIAWLFENKFDSIIALGNVAKTAGKIDRLKHRYPLLLTHNYELIDLDLHDVYNLVKSKDLKQRKKIGGITVDDSDILVGGLAIFDNIIKLLSPRKLFISSRSLREGIIYDYILSKYKITNDILDYSLDSIIHTLNINRPHAEKVYSLTKKLFDNLKPLHHLGDDYGKILKTSAMLHDCGISINYYNHHKHSFYIILESYINGLSHKEILLSASIAASHRFNNFSMSASKYSSLINQLDLKTVDQIGVLLKISEGLDRSLVGSVTDVDVSIDQNCVILRLTADENIDFEIRQAYRAKEKFKEIYNRDLVIIQSEI